MNRWDAFTAVCEHLRAGLLGGELPRRGPEVAWELLIEASSHHYVTPALAWCLKDQPDAPSEVRDYLDTVLALNARRNEALLAGLARIVDALNAIAIEPVLLKGAARLVAADYPAPTVRFLGDLDVLIPTARSADAVAALQAIGFRANAGDDLLPLHHHLPPLHDRAAGSGVELHTAVLRDEPAGIIATEWFCEGTLPFAFGSRQVRLPDATRSVGHIIAHDQLLHDSYELKRVELRQLLDLAMIRARHEGAIDWAGLDDRFCRSGRGEVLATYLEFARILLGQPAPRFRCAARAGALEDFRRVMEPPLLRPLSYVATLLIKYAAARWRDPRGVLKLFDLATWPDRIRGVIKTFERGRPRW